MAGLYILCHYPNEDNGLLVCQVLAHLNRRREPTTGGHEVIEWEHAAMGGEIGSPLDG